MAKFEKGVGGCKDTRINSANAVEYARRSAEVRRQKKTIRECVLDELLKPSSSGSKKTKMEAIIVKALSNGDIDIRGIKLLQDILGESITNIAISRPEIKVASDADAQAIKQLMGDETDGDIPQD